MPFAGSWQSESTGQPLTIAIEHAINMLLARVAFDLLRSPKFKQQVVAHIQKKLDELKVPDYINALQVKPMHAPRQLGYSWGTVGVQRVHTGDAQFCTTARLVVLCGAMMGQLAVQQQSAYRQHRKHGFSAAWLESFGRLVAF